MAYHGKSQTIADVKAFEKQTMEIASLYPDVVENCMSSFFFSHFPRWLFFGILQLQMAEVLDADAFAYFQEKGFLIKKSQPNSKTTYFQRRHRITNGIV